MAQINKSTDYFRVKTYSGNSSTQSITWDESDNMKPDWLWLKGRGYADGHALVDVIRGSTKNLSSDSTTAEFTQTNGVTSLDTNGWSMGNWSAINRSSSGTAVGWGWLADNTSGSSNTDGSITSTVSANTTSGFSIVSFTGDGSTSNVGHGLGVAPKFFIIKSRSAVENWWTYTTVIDGSLDFLYLNNTNAKTDSGLSLPTSSVFSVNSSVAPTSENIIAYCFAEKKGFSKFGSYTGNGSTDGTFVYTGFKPAFVIQKNTSVTQGWQLQDNKRLGYNPNNYLLQPHDSASESALQRIDLLSNGFKVRTTDAGQNASGNNYIYMAFAENPLVGTNNIPATAR